MEKSERALDRLDEVVLFVHGICGDEDFAQRSIEQIFTEQALRKRLNEISLKEFYCEFIRRYQKSSSVNHRHPELTLFRLSNLERMALIVSHEINASDRHRSYLENAQILGLKSESEFAMLLWKARQQFLLSDLMNQRASLPKIPIHLGSHCPDGNKAEAPWSQWLIDEEMDVRRRLFIQNHVLECRTCFQFLTSTREMIFEVDRRLDVELSKLPRNSREILEMWSLSNSESLTQLFLRSVRSLTKRRDVRWAGVIWLLACLFWYIL